MLHHWPGGRNHRWLYIADDANLQIIRVKLRYHMEKRVAIGNK
jgi:hypothetical protein